MPRLSQRPDLGRELRQGRRHSPGPARPARARSGPPVFAAAWGTGGRIGLLPVYLLLLVALLTISAFLVLDRIYAGTILPHVQIEGLNVGGMSEGAASATLRARYAAWLRQPLTLTFEERRYTPSPRDLGVELDLERSVGAAYAVGRSLSPAQTLPQLYALWQGEGVDARLALRIDQQQLRRYIAALAAEIDSPPRDARLFVENAAVHTTPAAKGRQLLVERAVAAATASLTTLRPGTVALESITLDPAIDDAAVATAAEQAATLLSAPFQIEAAGQRWLWQPAELAQLLRIDESGAAVRASIDRDQLAQRVAAISAEVLRPPREPKLRWADDAVRIAEPGQDGATVNVTDSVALLATALWGPARSVALPAAIVRPQVTPESLASLGIVELVAEGKSAFPGSANYRITNIANGARLLDGTLIPPGGTFAFNEHVEPVDESNGFVKGLAIVDNRTQQEWGGGLCQVSTTVFRAAFWAGVPIDERHEHSFRISWYEIYEPIGMDAAIFTGPGGNNLRFSNDTGHWLLMQTEIDRRNASLYVRIYGTKPQREVMQGKPTIRRRIPPPAKPVYINDPKLPAGTLRRTDIAQPGIDLAITRTVVAGDQVLREDTFETSFQPWPNIYVRGTRR